MASRQQHEGNGGRRDSDGSGGRPPLAGGSFPSPPIAHAREETSTSDLRWYKSIKSWSFIVDLAHALNLGKVATHTALVFFHRFFKHQSFEQHDRFLVGVSCIYLAAKVEERSNVKLSQIVVHFLVFMKVVPKEVDPLDYNRNPLAREQVPLWKNRVIVCERALLYTISFDLNVTHPFKALQDLMKAVREVLTGHLKELDHRTVFSQACKFLNDSFSLPNMIEVEPSYSAALAIYLTLLLYDIPAPPSRTWLEILQVQDETKFLDDCLKAIHTYSECHYRRLGISDVPEPGLVSLASALPYRDVIYR